MVSYFRDYGSYMDRNQKLTAGHGMNSSATGVERRREPRQPAKGKVVVRLDQGNTILRGEMVDVSPSGFRIRYRGDTRLLAGSEVDISYPWGEVKASIVWVRSENEWTEVGFLIL
jgi:hypothetical protein